MLWRELRSTCPDRWVIVEALASRQVSDQRIIEQVALVEAFEDSIEAWKSYRVLRQAQPEYEYHVAYTGNKTLSITIPQQDGYRPTSASNESTYRESMTRG